MKTRHHLAAAFCIAATLTAGIGLASCTEDARTPGADADPTTQPLIFTASMAASADAPATRSNTASGEWTDGDWVAVEANGVVKKYLVHLDNGTATLRPADADNTHFWPAAGQSVSVRAWRYGYNGASSWDEKPTEWRVQTGQAGMMNDGETLYQLSDFLYAPAKSVSYSPQTAADLGLTFYHQTARVVVNIREAGAVTAENKAMVKVYLGLSKSGYELAMRGTFDDEPIDPDAGQYSGLVADPTSNGYVIPKPISPATGYARSYEALVIPQDMSNKTLIQVEVNDIHGRKKYYYTPTSANLRGGYTYTYDITVSEHGKLEVTASEPIPGWVDSEKGGSGMAHEEVLPLDRSTQINDNRTYLLTGTNLNAPNNLVWINGGNPTIILRDVDIKGWFPIMVLSGTTILKVEGNNRIIDNGAHGIWVDKYATVRITGDGRDKSRLTVKTEGGSCAIGNDFECGNIDISGITLVAEGSEAAIGVGRYLGRNTRTCGTITITDSHVEATGGPGAAAIGFGYYEGGDAKSIHQMGDITITNSTLKCTVQKGPNNVWPAHIGGSANGTGQYTVGKISITPSEGMNGETFFKDFNGKGEDDTRVIVGFPDGAKTDVEFDVWWSNQPLGPIIRWGDVPGLP